MIEFSETGIPRLDDGGPKSRPFRPMPDSYLDRRVFSVFEAVALEHSSAIAIQSATTVMRFGDLLDRVRAIASQLMTAGDPGEPVALALPVDWQYPAAMLGCLAAGRPYVPLDLRHPPERLGWILEHSGASVMLLAGATPPIPTSPGCRTLRLAESDRSGLGFNPAGEPESVAYIVYTSGSTGRPKGVFQDQRGLMHDVLQYTNSAHLGPGDVSSLLYSPSVTGAIRDIYGALLNGACLCMGDLAGEGFKAVIERSTRCGITLLHAMPPVLRTLLREPGAREMLRRVRLAYIAGDRFLPGDLRLLRAVMPAEAFLYTGIGSTECATLYRQWFVPDDWPLEEGASIPVGYALPGRDVRICSNDGADLPAGETGVIHVRGRCLALGYWRDPELTARSFPGPVPPGASREFRTGDLGRIRPDGLLDFIGRADRQVKIRGYRVDPAETELALRSIDGITEAAVVVLDSEGVPRLVGCVEVSDAAALDETAVAREIAARLPSHLVPSRILVAPRLTRLPNFKLDTLAVKRWAESMLATPGSATDPAEARASDDDASAAASLARTILVVWEQVLRRSLPGIDVTWTNAGGDSLQALEALSAIERRTERRLTTAMIRSDATPTSMAREILRAETAAADTGRTLPRIHGKFWLITSGAGATVHDRRLIELVSDVIDGDVLTITSVEDELERLHTLRELAEGCAAAVAARTEPGVPAFLMGLSFGARVAFEAAAVLTERGIPVRWIGIGDIPLDASATRIRGTSEGGTGQDSPPRHRIVQALANATSRAKRSAIDLVEWLTEKHHQAALRWYVRLGSRFLGKGFALRSGPALRRGQGAAWKPRRFDGRVSVFVSAEHRRLFGRMTPALGWEEHAAAAVRVDLPGTHMTYHRDEQATECAEAIRTCLFAAAARERP